MGEIVEAALVAEKPVAKFWELVTANAAAQKPRPCPHGKVWLIGEQSCMCSDDKAEYDRGN